jgi:hypothetical protein
MPSGIAATQVQVVVINQAVAGQPRIEPASSLLTGEKQAKTMFVFSPLFIRFICQKLALLTGWLHDGLGVSWSIIAPPFIVVGLV